MRAKHFKKLRAEVKTYKVEETHKLFGFTGLYPREPFEKHIVVIARNPIEAARRARRRGYGIIRPYPTIYTTARWARFRVKEHNRTNHWRNIHYIE